MLAKRIPVGLVASVLLLTPIVGFNIPAAADEPVVTCQPPTGPETPPVPATITGSGFIVGTPGDDVIVGSTGFDVILGLGGNDLICGNGGNDYIDGGRGDDLIAGDAFTFVDGLPSGH